MDDIWDIAYIYIWGIPKFFSIIYNMKVFILLFLGLQTCSHAIFMRHACQS